MNLTALSIALTGAFAYGGTIAWFIRWALLFCEASQ